MGNDQGGQGASPAPEGGAPQNPAPGAQPPAPNGSEADTNPGGGSGEQAVPFSRFQEVNDSKKQAEERAAKAERELEELRQSQQQPPQSSSNDDEDGVDPDVRKLVTSIIEKEGYVKKDEVTAEVRAADMQRQYMEDVADLTSKYKDSGVPFDNEATRNWAKENGFNITGKASLEAAYRQMNFDKILEADRNAAITAFKENGNKTSAEKPGSTGAQQPEEKEVRGLKNRIRAANQRVSGS